MATKKKAPKKKTRKSAAAAQRAARKKAAEHAKLVQLIQQRLASLNDGEAEQLVNILGMHVEDESERLEEQRDDHSEQTLAAMQHNLDSDTELHTWLTQPLCAACKDPTCRCVACDGTGQVFDEETREPEKCLMCSGEYFGGRR